ncbi:SpoIIE family protein phosphatase [Streptomyces sp. NPDC048664]|uniref:SpoIIE family protein phosphatase n=1 Tax=Streptomyces sp. NPDC048664 TaxID=3154505 RepID=UPI00341C01B9
MSTADSSRADRRRPVAAPAAPPSGLLDLLSVAAVVLDSTGHVVFWSPPAEELFGYTPKEALGQFAARLLVHEEHWDEVVKLFADVMESGSDWAGTFPIRHKDGSTRLVEFRNMRLLDNRGETYALGLAADQATVTQVERDAALSARLVSQSPIGLAILDPDLRYLTVNPALERMHGLPAVEHVGRRIKDILTFLDGEAIEERIRGVLETGEPVADRYVVGRPPSDPEHEHAWSVSFYRLEDSAGRVLGVANSVIDITERHRAAGEAAQARHRLALIAEASARVGTTLDVEQTAHELTQVVVPDLADAAAVHILDSALHVRAAPLAGPVRFHAVASSTGHPARPPGVTRDEDLVTYDGDHFITRCVHTRRPVLVSQVTRRDLPHIAHDARAAAALQAAGVHTYLAVPLVARGEVLGVLDLKRAGNLAPFDGDDVLLASELAARAAVSVDNARWYQSARSTALTLQRRLLPELPSRLRGLEIACRYQPAGAAGEIGGDWFDAIALPGDKTALVVGDVMGSGINAAASMGQLRSATRAFAELDLAPAEVLRHLDHLTEDVEQTIATCVYCVYDPGRDECHISLAGHLPPALVRRGRSPELLELPTGVPLGVGGVPFETTTFAFQPGDQLVFYTDGLVETRSEPIDERLDTLVDALAKTRGLGLEEACDRILDTLRPPGGEDDVALLIARPEERPGTGGTAG